MSGLTPTSPTKPLVEYVPKTILVTGGAGFIASHVVILLAKKYPDVNIVNFDCLDYCSCLENLDEGEYWMFQTKDVPFWTNYFSGMFETTLNSKHI